MNTAGRKSKIANVSERVFLAVARNANFLLDFDNIRIGNKGIWIELDGHMDSDLISTSIEKMQDNIADLAKQFAKTLMDNKDADGLKGKITVDDINADEFHILHDEHQNKIYLFVPVESYNKKALENKKKNENKEIKDKVDGMKKSLDELISEFSNFISSHETKSKLIYDKYDNNALFFDERTYDGEASVGKWYGKQLDAYFQVDEIMGRKNDRIIVKISISFEHNGNRLYDKYMNKEFILKDYDLKVENRDMEGVYFLEDDEGENKKNLEKLVKEINEFKDKSVSIFAEDFSSVEEKGKGKEKEKEETKEETKEEKNEE